MSIQVLWPFLFIYLVLVVLSLFSSFSSLPFLLDVLLLHSWCPHPLWLILLSLLYQLLILNVTSKCWGSLQSNMIQPVITQRYEQGIKEAPDMGICSKQGFKSTGWEGSWIRVLIWERRTVCSWQRAQPEQENFMAWHGMALHVEAGLLRATDLWWKAVGKKTYKVSRSRLERSFFKIFVWLWWNIVLNWDML